MKKKWRTAYFFPDKAGTAVLAFLARQLDFWHAYQLPSNMHLGALNFRGDFKEAPPRRECIQRNLKLLLHVLC